MRHNPLVSIIMPAFNTADYIEEAVDSVIAQTWPEWELIIVNDGSTDQTSAILEGFHDQRITTIDQKNLGVSAARNAGLERAEGEFVTFLDADDILPPRSLEVRAEFLTTNRDIDIVDGQIIAKDENLDSVLRVYRPYYTGLLLPRLLVLDDRVFFGPFYMLRKPKLTEFKFPEKMTHAEDLLFFTLLAAKHQLRYSFVDGEIYHYRTRFGSAMSNIAGLEEGYLMFMKSIFSTIQVSANQKLFLKLKISKIMFLTWFRDHKYLRAIKSIYKCLF
jgi:glycosyltransferase involved in cell wall biosynthesis